MTYNKADISSNHKIRVLHIAKDDKFFNGVFAAFETDVRMINRAVLETKSVADYKFLYISPLDKLKLLERKSIFHELKDGDYDVIFFHSLKPEQYSYFNYIPKNKIIIWWCWGFEIYSEMDGLKAIIPIERYKPLTKNLHKCLEKSKEGVVKRFFRKWIINPYRYYQRYKVMKRIDYFQPVIPLEYQLMKKVKGFRADEFYYPTCFSNYPMKVKSEIQSGRNILIGNSQALTNNHIDVWNSIKKFIEPSQKVIFPVNYTGYHNVAEKLIENIQSESHDILFLKDFLPKEEYFKLIGSCRFAFFGVIRQQAMGNINFCINSGMKVFLYRDSLVYRFLKDNGYVVYAIEDINEESLSRALTSEEKEQNNLAFAKEKMYINKVRETAIENILSKLYR